MPVRRITPANTEQLRGILESPLSDALGLPMWKFSSGGAVAREIDRLDDTRLVGLYEGTLKLRGEIDQRYHAQRDRSDKIRDANLRDRLEMGRRALALAAARRGLIEPDEMARHAVGFVSPDSRKLDLRYHLDPGGRIAAGKTKAYARMLDEQRRTFWDRLFNRRFGVASAEVVDGDSVRLNGKIDCRLSGIDAPEWDNPGGPQAREHLKTLIAGQALSVKDRGRDKYGRRLVTLYAGPDDTDVNARMVADGYARAYGRYSSAYLTVQRRARRAGAGLWPSGALSTHPEKRRKAKGAER